MSHTMASLTKPVTTYSDNEATKRSFWVSFRTHRRFTFHLWRTRLKEERDIGLCKVPGGDGHLSFSGQSSSIHFVSERQIDRPTHLSLPTSITTIIIISTHTDLNLETNQQITSRLLNSLRRADGTLPPEDHTHGEYTVKPAPKDFGCEFRAVVPPHDDRV